jgi:hypothetical protein
MHTTSSRQDTSDPTSDISGSQVLLMDDLGDIICVQQTAGDSETK